MTKWPSVAVIGGSIGGLTAALLLRDLGCEVEIFERSSEELQSRGAGIVMLPTTERYLVEQGGEEARVSLTLTDWTYVDAAGEVLSTDPDCFRFGSWMALYRALLAAFGEDRYHLEHEMVGLDVGDDAVTVRFANGMVTDADLVVAADGLASTARFLLLPDAAPHYAGYVAWRGTVPDRDLSAKTRAELDDAMLYQIVPRGHILVYAIPGSGGERDPGKRLINFVWYRNYPTGGPFEDLMTDTEGRSRSSTLPPGMVRSEHLDDLRRRAEQLAPAIREVVDRSTRPFVQAIFDLESPRIAFGRVVLVGDAAFSARPHVAAGSAKAAADGWALRDALSDAEGRVDAALAAWEPRQLDLGRSVVEKSRRMGERSQFEETMVAGDPTWKFGLFEPGN
jgi:2,6-dihydroxypyridine 3-monooxygenase